MASDAELLEAWGEGDRAAGDALIERHFDVLFRFFEATAPSHAEDLVQETLAACVEARHRFRGTSSFRTFLLGIARHKVLMFWRTQARRGEAVDVGAMSLEDLGASPSQRVGDREQERLLLFGLRRIPLDDQIVLQLHYWDGLTGPQLAQLFEVPEGTVRGRLHRARGRLEEAIAKAGAANALIRTTIDNLERWAASVEREK